MIFKVREKICVSADLRACIRKEDAFSFLTQRFYFFTYNLR